MKKITFKLGFAIGLIVSVKALYSIASINALKWVLYPMIPVIELFTNYTFEWIDTVGFSASEGIIIEKSCAGGNFFCICFALLCFKLLKFQGIAKTILHFIFLGICSYFIMILANTARIISAIKLSDWEWTHAFIDPKTAHLALGSILYIFTLFIINHFISLKYERAQTT